MDAQDTLRRVLCESGGILRMIPNFLPRRFSKAGRRLRLHPDDYYACGTARGAIKERWFSSVIAAINGEDAAPDEGLSYAQTGDTVAGKIALRDFVEGLGRELLGDLIFDRYGTWPMYSKFFDYDEPLFFHMHLTDADAARIGRLGKPEAYYFPPQYNPTLGRFPHTYFGFDQGVTREDVKARLLMFKTGDNRITELSRAYRLALGTGWYTPPGVLHAPGSVLTYEPQWNSDVNSVYENLVSGDVTPYAALVENLPPDKQDVDSVLDLMDWEANTDPDYRGRFFRPPIAISQDENHAQRWITYGNGYVAAKELTVFPGRAYVDCDKTAYGCILVQGHGKFGPHDAETPTMLRFGQTSQDEYFVSAGAAARGVAIQNPSRTEPMVILKHFPACHPDMP